MARPCKRRRICALPGYGRFGPKNNAGSGRGDVVMTVDEFESIRLIDLEGMTQEECAAMMGVARTTAQSIYSSARSKIAASLVNGSDLSIKGGEYVLCDGNAENCGRHRCAGHIHGKGGGRGSGQGGGRGNGRGGGQGGGRG